MKFWKNVFFYWLKKSYEPSRIRGKRSHTRPKSCLLKFQAIIQALRYVPKRLSAINCYLLGGFSILTYHSILNFSNTCTPTGVVKSIVCSIRSIFENWKLSKLRKLKKETNGVGGKDKLIAKLIDELSVFYGLAIWRNKDSVKDMKTAI